MRRLYLFCIILSVIVFSTHLDTVYGVTPQTKELILATLENAPENAYRPSEVIVKFRSGVIQQQSLAVHKRFGALSVKRLRGAESIELVKLPEGVSVREAVQRYMDDPLVEYAEPNYIYRLEDTFPDDTYFSQQWGLHNTGQMVNAVPDADMDMPEAWDISTGSREFIVAVIDTGVDFGHPDLGPNIWINPNEIAGNGIDDDHNNFVDDVVGWDFVEDNNLPYDNMYHGTHVAGIIGALGNNAMGIAGVAWNVRMMVLKAAADDGTLPLDAIVQAIYYAVNMGADVINASYGSYTFSQSEYDALAYANSHGVLVVAAAGNDTIDNDLHPHYPSSYELPNIIAVAASDQDDQMATFSNYGQRSVDVFAPGNHTLSTWPTYVVPLGYETIEGTSMAAPHVAGMVVLLKDYYRNFDIYQIKATIENFVDRLPQFQPYVASGGRVNAYRALSSLLVPTDLVAEATDPYSVVLTWQDNATGEDGYWIERRTEQGGYVLLATVAADSVSYTDRAVEPGKTYTYRVIAFNSIGESPYYSNEATVVVPLSDSGGGGCSMVSRTGSESMDLAIIIAPVLAYFILRRRSR